MKINFIPALIIFSIVIFPSVSLGQATNEPSIFDEAISDEAAGNAQCFDYYRFGSVVTNISTALVQTVPGSTMVFSGEMTNENSYPVTDLDLYVKIFRKQAKDENALKNGHNLVDQFVAVDNVSIDANSSKGFSFEWVVPTAASAGEYMIATYSMTSEAYNLSGLSFTDDVTGASKHFTVVGKDSGTVSWDKNKVMMNETSFLFASQIPTFTKDEAVTVSAPFVNTTNKDKEVVVTWKQYDWDGLREEALVETKTETVTIPAGQSKILSYAATKYKGAVTYIVADAFFEDAHSILDMRFARVGVEQTRINFPSLTNFPLVANQPNALFSCLHVVGPNTLGGATLDLILTDEKGKVISQNKYEGSVTGAMMGVKYDFTPTRDYDKVTLMATLTRGGVIEDSGTITYDCEKIDPAKCLPKNTTTGSEGSNQHGLPINSKTLMFMIVIGLAAAFILVTYLKKSQVKSPSLPPLPLLVLGLLGATAILGLNPGSALANTTSWTSGMFDVRGYDGVPLCKAGRSANCLFEPEWGSITPSYPLPGFYEFGWVSSANLSNAVASVNYNADANYPNGASVAVGSTLDFTPVFSGTDISFNGTGSYSDSPYGTWGGSPLNYQTVAVLPSALFGSVTIYAALWVNRPTPTVVQTGGTGSANCAGLSCNVTAAGTLQFSVNYPATTGGMKLGFNKALIGTEPNIWYSAGNTFLSLPALNPIQVGCPSLPRTAAQNIQCYNAALANQFVLNVPAQSINFNFSATAVNAAPSSPTITTVIAGPAGSPSTFSFYATDPDGDPLHFEIDWTNVGFGTGCAPSTCADVPSGSSPTAPYTWAVPGNYTFQARTVAAGQYSAWVTHNIVVPAAPPINVNLNFLP